ncbi:uncharacterized protein [Coffea arabica]|uniref:Reverse transcriptase domain-containing protein n=1 Tax=Coffea arabica TaxID=13443 RepID=A0ABM4X4U7_COFAR
MVNGAAHGFFKSFRELRQGDPLSPALFVIGAEVLSRGLNNLAIQPSFLGFTVSQGCSGVTHLAFADDVLILTNGSTTALRRVMRVLDAYQRSSGQMLNVQKSGYLVHPSLSVARRRVIERITGFSRQAFPTRYLGFPLYIGRCKTSYFAEVCQKVLGKILFWKSKFLSSGGRLTLIKHVLSAIPIHLLSAAVMPKAVFRIIERACSNFLWGSSSEGFRYHWMGWSKLCLPPEEGGVGFRRLRDVYTAFSYKLWWQFRTGSSLWTTFMCAKYCRGLHPCQAERNPFASATWRRMQDVLPMDITAVVLSKSAPAEQSADEVVWMLARSGKFSLASAYQEFSSVHAGRLASWWLASPRLKRRQAIYHILPSLICRHLWKARNRAVFEGIQPQSSSICQAIFRETKVLLEGQLKERVEARSFLWLCEWASQSRGSFGFKLVYWKPAIEGEFTLNTDGCSKGNPGLGGGRGGVLRDTAGRPLCPWHIRGEVRQIWNLVRDPSRFSHCFREANKVADALANVGVAHPHQVVQLYEHWSDCPRLARGGVSLYSMGFPSLRTVRNP